MEEAENKEGKLKEARKVSIIEGSFSGFSSGIGDNYITPFAKALDATSLQIGMLSAFPNLLSPVAQMYGSRLIERKSRKEIVVSFVFLQSLLWIPFALIALVGWLHLISISLSVVLVVAYSIFAFVGGVMAPSWFSWMGDIVHENERGRYFGKRNNITGFLGMCGFVVGAFVLDYFSSKGIVLLGFTLLFSAACVFRFIGFLSFRKQYEPPMKLERKEYYFSFLQFIKGKGSFVKFSLYMGIFNFSTTIAGPFFAIYMLKQLNFSYVTFMIVSLSGTFFILLFTPLMGKISDRYGNLHLLYFSTGLLAVYPLLWAAFSKPLQLIFITQVVGGLANAAFAIGTTNFIYNIVTPNKRALCVSYMNLLVGIGIFCGSMLGGLLLNLFSSVSANAFLGLFVFSAIFRATVAVVYLPRLKELRTFEKVPSLFSILGTQPLELFESSFIWVRNLSKVWKKNKN